MGDGVSQEKKSFEIHTTSFQPLVCLLLLLRSVTLTSLFLCLVYRALHGVRGKSTRTAGIIGSFKSLALPDFDGTTRTGNSDRGEVEVEGESELDLLDDFGC